MGSKRSRHGVRLEMTSLMDVMFLVLVFFIYCVFDMSVHHGLKVDLPNASGILEKGERIVITIEANDRMSFNGKPMSRNEVLERVKNLVATEMKIPILISGDKAASLGSGLELLSQLKKAGVERVSFQVKGPTD